MPLDPSTLDALAVGGVALGGLGLAAAAAAHLRLRALVRRFSLLQDRGDEASFVDVVERHVEQVRGLREELAAALRQLEATRGALAGAVRHVSVVRFDAFGDAGGLMSFSAALLDDAGDGLVLTSINGRRETRTYAKGVTAGSAHQPLSPEERQAIASARGLPAPAGRRGRREVEVVE